MDIELIKKEYLDNLSYDYDNLDDLYFRLPAELQIDGDIILQTLKYCLEKPYYTDVERPLKIVNYDLFHKITDNLPLELLQNREFVVKFLEKFSAYTGVIHLPFDISDDKEIMLLVVGDWWNFSECSKRLKHDREVVNTAIVEIEYYYVLVNLNCAQDLGDDVLERIMDSVITPICQCFPDDLDYIADCINYVFDVFDELVLNDWYEYSPEDIFEYLPENLSNNPEFIRKITER